MGPLRLGRQKLTRPGHTHISAYNPPGVIGKNVCTEQPGIVDLTPM